MKKMNVFITALTLVITAVAPMVSSAATGAEKSTEDIKLSKTYDASYTLTLPDKELDLTESSVDANVKVNAFLNYGEDLTVSVKSTYGWELKDLEHLDNDENIPYKLKVGETDLTEDEAGEVMIVTHKSNKNDVEAVLTFCDFGTPTYAGTYSDTLTFSVTSNYAKEEAKSEDPTQAPTEAPTDTATVDESQNEG